MRVPVCVVRFPWLFDVQLAWSGKFALEVQASDVTLGWQRLAGADNGDCRLYTLSGHQLCCNTDKSGTEILANELSSSRGGGKEVRGGQATRLQPAATCARQQNCGSKRHFLAGFCEVSACGRSRNVP